MERKEFLIKNTGILFVSNFTCKIMTYLLVPFYTYVLSTEDFGVYDIVTSSVALLFPILTLNIVDAVMRFSLDTEKSKHEIFSIGKIFLISCWIFSFLVLYVIVNTNLFALINSMWLFFYLYFLFYSLNQFFVQFGRGLEKIKELAIASVISTALMILCNLLFLLVFKWGLKGFFVANTVSLMGSCFYLALCLKIFDYWNKWHINKCLVIEMLVYCLPLISTTLGWWINSAADKYVVTYICGLSASGLLGIAYKIPQIINTFNGIFIQAWQISAIKEVEKKDSRIFYGKVFEFVISALCILCSVLILSNKILARFLFKNDFYEAWRYVPFLLIVCVFNAASGLLGPVLSAKKDSKAIAFSVMIGAVVNMVLNITFAIKFGIQGVTIATLISSFVIYCLRKYYAHNDIYLNNYKTIVLSWIIILLQAFLEIYVSVWIYGIILFVFILIINYSVIKEMGYIICTIIKRIINIK